MNRAGREQDSYKFIRCYLLHRIEQSLNAVGLFPSHAEVFASHVAVGGELAVDGAAQVEVADDGARTQVEHLLHRFGQDGVGDRAGAEGLNEDGHGSRHAYRIGKLYLAALRKAGCDDVLRRVARGVGCAAVDFRGILAGESAAAVGSAAAIGVDDDLAPGKAGVALRPADDKAAGGVDKVLGVLVQQLSGNSGPDDLSIMSALICSRETSGECCVEMTTVSTLTGWRCSSYSTVTWVLPSGLR